MPYPSYRVRRACLARRESLGVPDQRDCLGHKARLDEPDQLGRRANRSAYFYLLLIGIQIRIMFRARREQPVIRGFPANEAFARNIARSTAVSFLRMAPDDEEGKE